jgi:hypothetical protein
MFLTWFRCLLRYNIWKSDQIHHILFLIIKNWIFNHNFQDVVQCSFHLLLICRYQFIFIYIGFFSLNNIRFNSSQIQQCVDSWVQHHNILRCLNWQMSLNGGQQINFGLQFNNLAIWFDYQIYFVHFHHFISILLFYLSVFLFFCFSAFLTFWIDDQNIIFLIEMLVEEFMINNSESRDYDDLFSTLFTLFTLWTFSDLENWRIEDSRNEGLNKR